MSDKFVSVVLSDGKLGPLFGPYDFSEAEQVLFAVLQSDRTDNGPVEITAEVQKAIELDGFYSFEGGGGVYIVEAEAFDVVDDDDEDEDDEEE